MKLMRGWLAVGLAMSLMFAGCGGDDEQQLECGADTVLEDGMCVPGSGECSEGEILTEHGTCVDPELYCDGDEDTEYDSETGQCVHAGDIECGEDTVAVDGECVVEDPLECGDDAVLRQGECVLAESVCGDNTRFDEDQLECRPDDDVCGTGAEFDVATGECVDLHFVECGDGTRVSGERCVSDETFADQLAADADIDFTDGDPIVPDTEESFAFTGTLDSQLTQTFQLEGNGGQWLEITIYSRGAPSLGLDVRKSLENWRRTVPPGQASLPLSRTVVIPADDDYELTVKTAMAESDQSDQLGNESWSYVGTVEVLETPDPQQWTDLDTSNAGDLRQPEQNYFEVDVTDTFDLLLNADQLGDDVLGARAEIWGGSGDHRETAILEAGQEVQIDTSDVSTVYLHFDAIGFTGSETDYEVSARTTEILEPGDVYEMQVDAEAGDLVFVSHQSNDAEPVGVTVRLDGDVEYSFDDVPAENKSSFDDDESNRQFFYAPQAGSYTVEFGNAGTEDILGFVGNVETEPDVPVLEVPADGRDELTADVGGSQLETGNWKIAVIDTPGAGIFEAAVEVDSGQPQIAVYDDVYRQQLATASAQNGRAELAFETPSDGLYYVVGRADEFETISGVTFEIGGQTLDTIAAGEVQQQTFQAESLDVLEGAVVSATPDAIDVRLLNEFGNPVFEHTGIEQLRLVELFPGTGGFTLEVENTTDETASVGVDVVHGATFDALGVSEDFTESYQRDPLAAGERDYMVVHSQDKTLTATLEAVVGDQEQIRARVLNVDESRVTGDETGVGSVEATTTLGPESTNVVELRAITDIGDQYDVNLDGVVTEELTRESSPGIDILPDSSGDPYRAVDTVEFPTCLNIDEISVDIEITHTWIGDLVVDIIAPSGDVATIHNQSGGTSDDIVGTYPDPDDSTLEDGEELLGFLGQDATGTWTIEIVDNYEPADDGTLESWGVTVSCGT